MLVFRSIALGLLGACVLLLAQRSPERVWIEHEREPVAARPAVAMPTIIDVASGLPGMPGMPLMNAHQIAQLVRLGPGERVTSVDDQPVAGNLDAGTAIGEPAARHFLDLAVAGPRGERRVLVLFH